MSGVAERPRVSVVIPAYRAAGTLGERLASIRAYLARREPSAELLVVVDGDADRSGEIARRAADADHAIPLRVLINETNRGKGFSVRRGMLAARGRYRVFTDADTAYPPEDIGAAIDALATGCDVAVGSRVMRGSTYTMPAEHIRYIYTRHVASRCFNLLARATIARRVNDTQCGLKGFTADAAERIFSRLRLTDFSFDIEVLFIASMLELVIKQVPVRFHYMDEPSTVTFLVDAARMLRDMARVRVNGLRGLYDEERTPAPAAAVSPEHR